MTEDTKEFLLTAIEQTKLRTRMNDLFILLSAFDKLYDQMKKIECLANDRRIETLDLGILMYQQAAGGLNEVDEMIKGITSCLHCRHDVENYAIDPKTLTITCIDCGEIVILDLDV